LISIIDIKGNEYKFSSLEFETEASIGLTDYFKLDLLSQLWGSFTYSDHCSGKSKILFPKKLSCENLYQNPFESKIAVINLLKRLIGNGNIYDRVLTNEILKVL
jgi:hypothetical protein